MPKIDTYMVVLSILSLSISSCPVFSLKHVSSHCPPLYFCCHYFLLLGYIFFHIDSLKDYQWISLLHSFPIPTHSVVWFQLCVLKVKYDPHGLLGKFLMCLWRENFWITTEYHTILREIMNNIWIQRKLHKHFRKWTLELYQKITE